MTNSIDIPSLTNKFDAILRRYQTWSAPLSKYTEENLPRVNRDGYTWGQFERGLTQLETKMRAEYDPYADIYAILDDLCPSYLAATSNDRAQIRALVSNRRDLSMLVRGYADKIAAEIHSPNDAGKLRYALAAISIEDCQTDYRDTLTTLADLFVRAEEVGIEPMPHFRLVAGMSSAQIPRGGEISVAEILQTFDTYAVVGERRRMGKPYRKQ